jgi:hypothetical protein
MSNLETHPSPSSLHRFLFREESIQKARERLSKDVYVSGGAWDMSKVISLTPPSGIH